MRATIYNASAGSGKTYTLAYKYVRDVIEEPMLYRNILAVTFTNKATEEMKRRILSEIHSLAAGDASNYLERLQSELSLSERVVRKRALQVRGAILHDYSRFTILTIDRFFQRIIRAFIQELGIDINYNIELDPATILSQSADRIIEEVSSNDELKRWISEFIEERIEDGRSWDIHEGVLSLGGEIFKESNRETLERPNSKAELKAIVDRFQKSSEQTKAHMKKCAERALEIVAELGLTTESFNGKSRSFAKYFNTIAAGEIKEPTKTQRDRSNSTDGWGKGAAIEAATSRLQPILFEIIETFDNNIKQWNTASLLRENYRSFALLTDLYKMVNMVSNEQNMMLLSETKLILSKFIANNDVPFIYEKVGNRFDRYMIDEFQDTSLKEWHNFLPLLQNAMSQSEKSSVLIVGDIKQSIYRWRGGDWRILHSLARRDMGAESTEVVNLKENYRSLPNIVKFNNALIEAVVSLDNTALNGKLESALERQAISVEAHNELKDMLQQAYTDHAQTPRKSGESDGYVELTIHDDEPQIVERIKGVLDQGFKPCEILILVRSNTDGIKIAEKLLEFKRENRESRYYFDVMTQEALVVGLAPVSQFIVAVLTLAVNQEDSIQRAIYNRFLGDRGFDAPLSKSDCEFIQSIRMLSTEEAFEGIVIYYELDKEPNNIAYMQAIHESICNFCSSKNGDITLFLKWWEEHGAARSISVEQSEKSIEITTIHKAKGLEKAVVMIPYCTWSLDPKSGGGGKADPKKTQKSSAVWAEASDQLDELGAFPVKYKKQMGESLFSEQYFREFVYSHIDNINMLYVALTRASQALHIFIKRGKIGVGRAITEVLPSADGEFKLGDLEGFATASEDKTTISFGEKSAPLTRSRTKGNSRLYIMDSYPTSQADLRLRLPSQRYFEQDQQVELSPRHEGILMHKVFAEAATSEEIGERLSSMLLNGQISQEEHKTLKVKIDKALETEPIKGWFTHTWETVHNEHDIILPKSSSFKRPDRVMISGNQAVVVDYKFGIHELKEHRQQIEEYKMLLEEMGYRDVIGYLWYIKSGKIVAV
ncbi:MAG: UvrD-helicase domain-containing protein [Rikenellaceae bacterium]